MENLINLKDLLNHEILDLYSAEKQIIEALPSMIDEVTNTQLRNALERHLEITKVHKERIEKVYKIITGNNDKAEVLPENKSFFSRLFGGVTEPKCKGIEGLIKEGEKIVDENMTPEVRDAAIIAAAQKIEHYEISGYGTALAYAKQLNLEFVKPLLEETLNEEYEADDLLTQLAVSQLNIEAQNATDDYKINDTARADLDLDATPENIEGRSLYADYARDIVSPVANENELDENPPNRSTGREMM